MVEKLDLTNTKIALISFQRDAERVPPIGLVYLATFLRDRIGLLNENIKIFDSNFYTDIEKEIDDFKPHIIGLSTMTVNYMAAIAFAELFKKKSTIPIIVGGVHVSSLPESLKKCFDLGVIGEGEETLGELVLSYIQNGSFDKNNLMDINGVAYFDGDKVVTTQRRAPIELDTLPLPDFRFAHPNFFREEEIPGISQTGIRCYLLSSRGCPYRCEFCSTSRFWGKMRVHSPEYTARIVEKAILDFNADYIKVEDDLFTLNAARLNDIRTEFEKRGILDKIKGIECQPRANLISEKLCQAMKDIKVRVVNFGFESGSDRVLKFLKVGTVTVEMNKNAVVLCKKYGLNVYGSLMYGSPDETLEDMEKTNDFIDFCSKNGANYLWSFVATPFPATPFWNVALERGTVSNDMDFNLLQHHGYNKPLLLDPDIDREEFQRVFFKGRKKLRTMKIRLIRDFVFKNPFKALLFVLKEPGYYMGRVYRQVVKQ